MITETDYLKAKKIVEDYELSNGIKPVVISSVAVPEWLSTQHRIDMIKELWNEPNINNSNPRVKAIQLAKSFAKEYGYEIDIKKATEVIRQHCV